MAELLGGGRGHRRRRRLRTLRKHPRSNRPPVSDSWSSCSIFFQFNVKDHCSLDYSIVNRKAFCPPDGDLDGMVTKEYLSSLDMVI